MIAINSIRLLAVCLIAIIFIHSGHAQITLTNADIGPAGRVVVFAIDTLVPGFDPGPPGPDQIWDLSGLDADRVDTFEYVLPDDLPGNQLFPDANLAQIVNGMNYSFLRVDDSAFRTYGLYSDFGGIYASILYNPYSTEITFPFGYQSMLTNNYSQNGFIPGEPFPPLDSIIQFGTTTSTTEADAYGMMTTDAGTFEVLRLKTTEFIIDTIIPYAFGIPVQVIASTDTIVTYNWYTKGAGAQIAIHVEGSGGIILNADVELITTTSDFSEESPSISVFPNPAESHITIFPESELPNQTFLFHLFSPEGRLISSQQVMSGQAHQLSLAELPTGLYTYHLFSPNGKKLHRSGKIMRK